MISFKNEAGFSLLSVIFAILMLSTMGLALAPLLANRSLGSVEDLQGQQAFYAADGGLQYVLMKEFRKDLNFSDNEATRPTGDPFNGASIPIGMGEFWIQYAHLEEHSADITATGRVNNSVRKIFQQVEKDFGASGAVHSGENVDLESKQDGGGNIDGPTIYGEGDGTHFNYDGGYDLSELPEQGPGPPPVDLQPIIALTDSTHSGNLTIGDGANFNGYVHVTGNLIISGGGTVTGIIVAAGNVTFDVKHGETRNVTGTVAAGGSILSTFHQDAQGTFTAQEAGGVMLPLLIAGGDINFDHFQDTVVTYNGLIRSGGDVDLKMRQGDQININGGLVASGNITIDSKQDSNLAINYDGGLAFLPSRLKLTNWSEV